MYGRLRFYLLKFLIYNKIKLTIILIEFIKKLRLNKNLVMAKKSMIEREKKRIKLTKKYALKRATLLKQYQSEGNFNLKLELHSKLQKLPRNSAKTRIRNRCWKTGRPRGVFRDFGLSRHVFREMAHQCLLPGVRKSSW
jgi:small subunit ribosomal protein S14